MKKNNAWFLVSGILSILEMVAIFFTVVISGIFLLVLNNKAFDPSNLPPDITTTDLEIIKSILFVLLIICIIFFFCLLFMSIIYFKNKSKTPEELKKSSGLIITTIVISFIVGGILIGAFGLLGYMMPSEKTDSKEESVENSYENTNQTQNNFESNEIKKQLEQLKDLKDSGIITEEEYDAKRKDIIKNL